MTEQEWMEYADPTPMLEFLNSRKNKRKLALFGVACCRHISLLASDERSVLAIEVSERFADRKARINEVRMACRNARENASGSTRPLGRHENEIAVLYNAAFNTKLVSEYALKAALDQVKEKALHCALLREIFGNPFQRVRINRRWLTPTVLEISEQVYSQSRFGSLRVLADALEEAGCERGDILAHCRQLGPHVRGCWVIDLILGKSGAVPGG